MSGSCRVAGHLALVANYIFALWYDVTFVHIPFLEREGDMKFMKGRLKFLTIWNMLLSRLLCAVLLSSVSLALYTECYIKVPPYPSLYTFNGRKDKDMGAAQLPFIVFTALWGGVAFILPFVVPKGPNRGIIRTMLMLTGVSCWMFWLCTYMAQMNPLIGPKLKNKTIFILAKEWGHKIIEV